jgi:AbrB family looped-hinge helix DNA binding protein
VRTKLSRKGQVVIPNLIRKKMGLRSGDPLDAVIEDGRIVLTPRKRRSGKARIIKDPVTGFPVLTLGPKAPILTARQVKRVLADFP